MLDDGYDFEGISYGDNALTNFTPDQKPLYERAIARYHELVGEERLYIGAPIQVFGRVPAGTAYMFALRLSVDRRDMSDFWSIFDEEQRTPL
jgi:hypothetical protein